MEIVVSYEEINDVVFCILFCSVDKNRRRDFNALTFTCTVWSSDLYTLLMRYEVNLTPILHQKCIQIAGPNCIPSYATNTRILTIRDAKLGQTLPNPKSIRQL